MNGAVKAMILHEREQIAAYVAAQAEWEPCDCGCPDKRTPKSGKDVDLIRLAGAIRMGKHTKPTPTVDAAFEMVDRLRERGTFADKTGTFADTKGTFAEAKTDSRCNYIAVGVCRKCWREHDGGGSLWPGIIDPDGVKEAASDACLHDDTQRLGAIWTRCNQCGKQWADEDPTNGS